MGFVKFTSAQHCASAVKKFFTSYSVDELHPSPIHVMIFRVLILFQLKILFHRYPIRRSSIEIATRNTNKLNTRLILGTIC